VQVKALACELPHRLGLPLSRLSLADLQQEVVAQGLVAEISDTTLWRWLNADALRPWQHRSWIFPRDPDFAAKAGRVLDLHERRWEGVPLRPTDFVFSADEKTSVQARRRKQPTLPGASGRPTRVEHDYVPVLEMETAAPTDPTGLNNPGSLVDLLAFGVARFANDFELFPSHLFIAYDPNYNPPGQPGYDT
jgi:hypothetical protein